MPLKPSDASLNELYAEKSGTKKKFVVVEESRLRELTALENALREEKEKLGDQCVELLSDVNTSARIPVPAMRLAVHNICEARMRESARQLADVIQKWHTYAKANGYDRTHVYLTRNFVKSAPLAERALKMKLMQQAAAGWRARYERETMQHEDETGHLMRVYVDAQHRRRDYDRYFVLATRYGVFSQAEFSADSSPGDRYFKKVTSAALMLQRRWDMYWPMKKLRMHRAARFMQTLFRRYAARKKWYPIIRLRLKYGKRTYYRFCWDHWLHYNYLCRQIRELIAYHLHTYVRLCFASWRHYWVEQKKERTHKMELFVLRAKSGSLFGFFMKWIRFKNYSQRVLRTARRIVQNPHFAIWYEYARRRKYMRRRHLAAVQIQRHYKGILQRRVFSKVIRARSILAHFFKMHLARILVKRARAQAEVKGFHEWLPGELASRYQKALEKERRRLISCQQTVHDKEGAAVADLRRHFKTKNGRIQIEEAIKANKKRKVRRQAVHNVAELDAAALQQLQNYRAPSSVMGCFGFNAKGRYQRNQVKEELIHQCSNTIRLLGVHDFNARSPPLYKCVAPGCHTYFVSEEQYALHLSKPTLHRPLPAEVAPFHSLLKSSRTQEQLRRYFGIHFGINTQVNCLDLWASIQEWRKISIKTESYIHKAVSFYETHVRHNCPRPVNLNFDTLKLLHAKMDVVLNREYEGFYRLVTAEPGVVGKMLGYEGKSYEEWTTENIIPADLFDNLEYECFMSIYSWYSSKEFQGSEVCKALQDQIRSEQLERRSQDHEAYLQARRADFLQWGQEYKKFDAAVTREAIDWTSVILENTVDALVSLLCEEESLRDSKRRGYEEQVQHEQEKMLADDTVTWTEDLVLESVYNYYSESIVKAMWEKPDSRKSLMEFAGYLEPKRIKLKVDWKKRRNEANDWFNDFFMQAVKDESKSLPLDSDGAAVRIQKVVRRRQGLKKARKIFVATYGKRLMRLLRSLIDF
jgi:hypothetical protein